MAELLFCSMFPSSHSLALTPRSLNEANSTQNCVKRSISYKTLRRMFSVGPNFQGIKMLPPGLHFVYYSSSNKEGHGFSPTTSFFLTIHPCEVVVRKWCRHDEQLINVSEDEECMYFEMVKRMEFDQHLGPYPLDHYGNWKRLSCYISTSTISRIESAVAKAAVAHESVLLNQEKNVEMEKGLVMQLKNSNLFECSSEKTRKRGCFFTSIPKVVKHKNITGEELTSLNLDKSKLLDNILRRNFGGEEDLILGELQFSFIAFTMGQSWEAFIQWKDLVCLFFSCIEAPLRTRSQFFTKVIRVVYFQLKHGFAKEKESCDDNGPSLFLDDDWFSTDIFLYRLSKDFFPLVLDAEVIDGDLLLWTRRLKKFLETTLGWDFMDGHMNAMWDEDDEYAPVVVPLNETIPMLPMT